MTEGNNTNLTSIKATTSSCGKCEIPWGKLDKKRQK